MGTGTYPRESDNHSVTLVQHYIGGIRIQLDDRPWLSGARPAKGSSFIHHRPTGRRYFLEFPGSDSKTAPHGNTIRSIRVTLCFPLHSRGRTGAPGHASPLILQTRHGRRNPLQFHPRASVAGPHSQVAPPSASGGIPLRAVCQGAAVNGADEAIDQTKRYGLSVGGPAARRSKCRGRSAVIPANPGTSGKPGGGYGGLSWRGNIGGLAQRSVLGAWSLEPLPLPQTR